MKEKLSKKETADLALRLQAVIDTAIDGIITIDKKGTIETFNQAASKLFGYKAEEVIGQNVSILMTSEHDKKHDGYLRRYNDTKVPHIIGIGREVEGKTKDGEVFPFRLAVSEVILNDRVIFTGIIHDMTAVNKANDEIIQLNKRLEKKVTERTFELEAVVNKLLNTNKQLQNEIRERESMQKILEKQEKELRVLLDQEKELGLLKSRFVSMASHEFRTPLTSILSSTELLSKYTTTETQEKREKHINRITSAVKNLTAILNDFLSLSRLEENKHVITRSTFDLHDLLLEIKEDTASIMGEHQQIILEVPDRELVIESDKHIVKNILFNLISNAIKYSEKDITIHAEKKNSEIEVHVIDSGIGIPLVDQKHLFTRFFRASNVTNIQGTGLGLPIVKQYVDLLNGDIQFESVPEEGSTFTIKLPSK